MRTKSFRQFLTNEFKRRTNANPLYSIRAFARDLAMNDSTLSQIIHGKRTITPKRISQLCEKLKVSQRDMNEFLKYADLIAHDDVNVELDTFNLISEWYHDAIIELVKIPNIQTDYKSIAAVIGITPVQAKLAMEQLKELEIIIEDESGRLICNQAKALTSFYESTTTTEALKNYQHQILDLSQKALATQPREQRNHTTYVIAIDSKMLDEVNSRVRKFQHDLANYIEDHSENKDKVYALQFSNFEITRMQA